MGGGLGDPGDLNPPLLPPLVPSVLTSTIKFLFRSCSRGESGAGSPLPGEALYEGWYRGGRPPNPMSELAAAVEFGPDMEGWMVVREEVSSSAGMALLPDRPRRWWPSWLMRWKGEVPSSERSVIWWWWW